MKMPDEIAERITESHWNGGGYGVTFTDIYQHNACNHTLSGHIDYNGETLYFIVHNGDWNGFEVVSFGTVDDVGVYTPPEPTQFMFVPKDDSLKERFPEMYKVYQIWTKTKWFIEKLGNYHYDRHFQPGGCIENYYRAWADSKGLKIVPLIN
jgi:hypothetical protein